MKHSVLIDQFTIDDISSDILRDIYQCWLDMKGKRPMPSRADLDPTKIISLLPYIILIDVEEKPRRYRYRLVGTEAVRTFGQDITGKYFDELPQVEEFVRSRSDWIVKEKRPYMYSDKLKWSSSSILSYQTISLPLSSNGTDVDILMIGMCCLFPTEPRTEVYSTRS